MNCGIIKKNLQKEVTQVRQDNLHDLQEKKEKAILVLLPEPKEIWQESELYQELAELSRTAGLEVVDTLLRIERTRCCLLFG